jgi:hypothetical protein
MPIQLRHIAETLALIQVAASDALPATGVNSRVNFCPHLFFGH